MFNDTARWLNSSDEFEPRPADNMELVSDLEDAIKKVREATALVFCAAQSAARPGDPDRSQNTAHLVICSTLWHNFWHPTKMQGLPGVRHLPESGTFNQKPDALYAPHRLR
jgi:hypothetical protein